MKTTTGFKKLMTNLRHLAWDLSHQEPFDTRVILVDALSVFIWPGLLNQALIHDDDIWI